MLGQVIQTIADKGLDLRNFAQAEFFSWITFSDADSILPNCAPGTTDETCDIPRLPGRLLPSSVPQRW